MADNLNDIYEYHFSEHKATLIQNTDRYCIIDWGRDDSNDCYVNYIVDKLRGSLIISGDLGDCIATWYNKLEPSQIKTFIHNDIGYFMSKFQCTSDMYDYDSDDILADIKERLDSICDNTDFELFFAENDFDIKNKDELWHEIEDEITANGYNFTEFHPTERLNDIISEFDTDCWEWLPNCGKRIKTRVYLWAEGFYRACEQLGL